MTVLGFFGKTEGEKTKIKKRRKVERAKGKMIYDTSPLFIAIKMRDGMTQSYAHV
jgi:hypothetical protein